MTPFRMIRNAAILLMAIALTTPAQAAVEIQEVTSPGGLSAWLTEEHSIPFVALELRFKGGSSLDPKGARGATSLMASLLEEGAGDLDAQGFATAKEALAASFSFDSSNDVLSVSARFLTENRDEAIALLKSALTKPRFDPDAIERVRGQILSILRSNETDPGKIASKAFDALTWADHPYETDELGTQQSAADLTRDDVLAAHKATLARDRVYISAVGDITPAELGALMDTLLGDLPETGAPQVGNAEIELTGGLTVIPFETPQSVALFGHAGIPFDDPDFIPAYLLMEVFGGGAESRLNEEVREKRGLTYGIGTYLSSALYGEMIIGQFASANARMAEGIEVVRAEWAKIAESGLTEQELADAKLYLTGAYPLRFDSNAAIANIMAGMQFRGQSRDYIATRNDKVNAVTLEEINRVAKRIFHPQALHFVVVGQPEGLITNP
ncbi:MAG: zinc protease [Halocynthiibacter sp.]|jgi:zinc protease